MICNSTHGAADYAYGSYWDREVIVCGVCGARISDPQPTGARWQADSGLGGFLGHGKWIPTWPTWIWGARGVPWKGCKHGYINSDDCAECCH